MASKRSTKIVGKLDEKFEMSDAYKQLAEEYFTLAHRADSRMLALEKMAASDDKYKNVKDYAYSRAQKDMGGGTRFEKTIVRRDAEGNESLIPYQTLQASVNDINHFLESQTSTKSGIEKTYQKRADTLNKQYDLDLTWEDISEAYDSGTLDKLKAKVGSDVVFKTLATVKALDKDVIKQIKKDRSRKISPDESSIKDMVFTGDEVADNQIRKVLLDNDIDLYKKKRKKSKGKKA